MDPSMDQKRGVGGDSDEATARVSSREALRFLTRAGRVLSASLDPDQTLKRLVRLAVPRVACFVTIDLMQEDGQLERVAFAHVDPGKQPLLERDGPFRPRDDGLLPIAQVLETGQALMIENVEEDWSGSDAVLDDLRQLDGRSLMIVPLVVREGTLGTLSFGSTRTDRHYRPADLALAGELARSAGLALDNARLYRRAEQAIRARDEVLSVVSHDLRNPVTRVRLGAQLLLEGSRVEEGSHRTVNIIIRAADEMNRLIGDLLDVARIEAGRLSLESAPLSLTALLEQVDVSHAPVARENDIEWRVEKAAYLPIIEADETRLMQSLGNLIGNAMKFTPKGGEVRIDAVTVDDKVRIGVHDSGEGMDPDQLAHVFDRFWQARPGDRRGAGLGLAIARGIAEAHGGRLWLESEPGTGTTAWLELPIPTG